MLFDKKKRLKAKQYQFVTIDKENHLIKPVGSETEIVEIEPDQLVSDFITLISEYAKCRHLRIWQCPQSYVGVSSKEDQNRIANLNAHIFKEQALMEDALMAFINKYGLFGLLNDEVAGFDYFIDNPDGSKSETDFPVSVIIPLYDDSNSTVIRKFRIRSYEDYIRPFFPDIPAPEAVRLKGEARICQYSEYMEDILQNKRLMACTEYIAGIDKQSTTPLIMQNMNAVLSFREDEPMYDIKYRSLIEYCHTMFFLNEIAGENKTVRICQYRRCHRPFIGRNGKYCCEACMRNANKAKKKGAQNNG